MNWEAVAAIAQVVGTIGVIITLVFLAVQVRANIIRANLTLSYLSPRFSSQTLTAAAISLLRRIGASGELTDF